MGRSAGVEAEQQGDEAAGAGLDFVQGAKGVELDAIFLTPIPITKENLNLVIDAGWVTKAVACQGVDKAKAPKACM